MYRTMKVLTEACYIIEDNSIKITIATLGPILQSQLMGPQSGINFSLNLSLKCCSAWPHPKRCAKSLGIFSQKKNIGFNFFLLD